MENSRTDLERHETDPVTTTGIGAAAVLSEVNLLPTPEDLKGNGILRPADQAVLDELVRGVDDQAEVQRIEALFRRSIARKNFFRHRQM